MANNLRVHIAPVGFQFRRVTEPLVRMQADKVYLVTCAAEDDASRFFASVKKELYEKYRHITVEEVFVDLWDLYACAEKFREIMAKERNNGNHIYVNVSTGTKITAMAGMLACMLWGGHPYYARVSYPKEQKTKPMPSELVEEPDLLPVYEVKKPDPNALAILGLLKSNHGKLRKGQLIQRLEQQSIIRLKDETKTEFTKAAKHSQLRALLDPLENEWGYVNVESKGRRSEVVITPKGETALRVFG